MKKPDLYHLTVILLSIAIVAAIGFFIFNMSQGQFGRAALSVNTEYGSARVIVNGRDMGDAPIYSEDILANNLNVEINGESNSYSTIIKPAAGTLAFIHRDLGVSDAFSSGQNLWMTKIGGESSAVFVTSPDTEEVSIIVDGVEVGKTPHSFTERDLLNVNEEGRYTIVFRKPGYEEQELNIHLRSGYELNIRVDMFLRPIPEDISTLSGLPENIQFINLAKVNDPAYSDRQVWARALNYWLQTRGSVNIGNNGVSLINYFFADDGKVYNSEGNEISPSDTDLMGEDELIVAYLGSEQTADITSETSESINAALGVATSVSDASESGGGQTVRITDTGIGFLRVRSGPGTGNAEVGRLDVGATVTVLEETNGWYKVVYSPGNEGWISSTYTQAVN